jgi:tripartite-type tricarboxylate transporter receptor subunit TctC
MWRKICKLTMIATGIFALVLTPTDAQIGQYPTSAITLVVPQPPGGATDLIGRSVKLFYCRI